MTLGEILVAAGTALGAAGAAFVGGLRAARRSEPSEERPSRTGSLSDAPTLESRVLALETARARDVADREAQLTAATNKATARALRALIEGAREQRAREKEKSDGDQRRTDPPTDP